MDDEFKWLMLGLVALMGLAVAASTCETAMKTYEHTHAPAKESPRGE